MNIFSFLLLFLSPSSSMAASAPATTGGTYIILS